MGKHHLWRPLFAKASDLNQQVCEKELHHRYIPVDFDIFSRAAILCEI